MKNVKQKVFQFLVHVLITISVNQPFFLTNDNYINKNLNIQGNLSQQQN